MCVNPLIKIVPDRRTFYFNSARLVKKNLLTFFTFLSCFLLGFFRTTYLWIIFKYLHLQWEPKVLGDKVFETHINGFPLLVGFVDTDKLSTNSRCNYTNSFSCKPKSTFSTQLHRRWGCNTYSMCVKSIDTSLLISNFPCKDYDINRAASTALAKSSGL